VIVLIRAILKEAMRDIATTIAVGIVAVTIGVFVFSYVDGPIALITRDAPGATPVSPHLGPVVFTQIAHGAHSSVTRRTNYIVTSSSELTELWKMIEVEGQPPAIDFATHEVIAVFAGKEPTAGYDIKVSQVEDSASRKVTVLLTKPGGSCLLAQSVTNPYQVIVVPKTALDLTHEDLLTTVGCLQ